MTVAVIMPSGITDEWRARARTYVEEWYRLHVPSAEIVVGECPAGEEWSKGAAVADGIARAPAGAPVLVLADADSFLHEPSELRRAIDLVASGVPWITPHRRVYRLREAETARLHELGPGVARPRLGHICRAVYEGPLGGGITVIGADTFERVGGIDRRFLGWGGEDVAFGWALQALAPDGIRLEARLVHLWHPHPAPNLRGSPASEELVAKYQAARGVPRRMAAVISGETWAPLPPLDRPVRFRMTANRQTLRLPAGDTIRFRHGIYETSDPDEVEQLRGFTIVREERPR